MKNHGEIVLKNDEIFTLSNSLLSTLDEVIFLSELCEFIKSKIDNDKMKIYKILEDGKSELSSIDGKKSKVKGETSNLSNYVSRTKISYYSNSIHRDPLLAGSTHEEGIEKELCVPVTCQGSVIATINVLRQKSKPDFSQLDIEVVVAILQKIERPIVNLNMYISAKRLNEVLMKKIELKEKELKEKSSGVKINKAHKINDRDIIGNSSQIKDILVLVEKISPSDSTVLIEGESGTGKELIARKIHLSSKRKDNSYVVVNCGALQETLLESELFGHEKGSFTGAIANKPGLVEIAHGGTLFLDEVGELTLNMQTKLLRFLQEGEAMRIGGKTPYQVDVRIISATNRDLKSMVDEGTFREDLYYRLNTINLEIPALRERGDDITLLANFFLNGNLPTNEHKTITSTAAKILRDYAWPGNIRELSNVMERASIMADGKFIEEFHLPEYLKEEKVIEIQEEEYLEMTLEALEKKHICNTLTHLSGNKTKTAKALGITVKTLYNKLHSYGMIDARQTGNF